MNIKEEFPRFGKVTQKIHKAFVNDRPLVILDIYAKQIPDEFAGYEIVNEGKSDIKQVVALLDDEKKDSVLYLSPDVEQSWKKFISLYILIEAAGGLVKNPSGQMLFIFRNGKWDLPKGKAEYDETPEVTAIREVEEECGVKDLILEKELTKTFHTYSMKGKRYLKKTHWYLMRIEEDQKLTPQTEEGITEVRWMDEEEVKRVVLSNTFSSVKDIFR